jgi:hypothetical protein
MDMSFLGSWDLTGLFSLCLCTAGIVCVTRRACRLCFLIRHLVYSKKNSLEPKALNPIYIEIMAILKVYAMPVNKHPVNEG